MQNEDQNNKDRCNTNAKRLKRCQRDINRPGRNCNDHKETQHNHREIGTTTKRCKTTIKDKKKTTKRSNGMQNEMQNYEGTQNNHRDAKSDTK